jgi:hypothetical protein
MSLRFNLDRPKPGDDEIKKGQDFNALVEQFKKQSLKKARGDESWRKNKLVRYSAIIAGATVVCTVTLVSILKNPSTKQTKHESITTQNAAKSTSPKKRFISAPSEKLKIPYSTYKVDSDKGGAIGHHTSTRIKIPGKSFIDRNGKDIVGEVTIQYREFHDEGDIIAGGIPMKYDSAGSHYNLETAGMFEITGEQNGEPVFIKKDKNLTVELASKNNEDRFNQYYLDTNARNWSYLKRDEPVAVKKQIDQTRRASEISSIQTLAEQIIPKQIDSVRKLYSTKISRIQTVSEPAKPVKLTAGRPTFKFEGSYDEFPELSAFDNVVFEVGPENKNYSPELHEITWSDVKIGQGPVKGRNYILDLSYRSRRERLVVYPVLTGKDYEKARTRYEEQLENYNALLEKKKAEEQRLMAEMEAKQSAYMALQKKKLEELRNERERLAASVNAKEMNELSSGFNTMSNAVRATRIFSVSRFGIYNSDCPHKAPEGNDIKPVFVSNGRQVTANAVYLVDHTDKSVYQVEASPEARMKIKPDNEYSLCLFNKNRMYLCNKKDFRQATGNNSSHFEVTQLPDEADNLVDFKKALEL